MYYIDNTVDMLHWLRSPVCCGVICFLYACSLLIQDGLSEDQWKEAEEVAASANVREVWLPFDVNSRQRSRAVQTISDGLASAKNKYCRNITLQNVPKEMKESVRQTLKTVTDVTVN